MTVSTRMLYEYCTSVLDTVLCKYCTKDTVLCKYCAYVLDSVLCKYCGECSTVPSRHAPMVQ
jgi:hypothetical protein